MAGSTLLAAGETLKWKGAADANGSALNAFTVKAWDGAAASATAVQVSIDVAAVNDAPRVVAVTQAGTVTEDLGLGMAGMRAQKERLTLSGTYQLDDSLSVSINGIAINYTVVASDLSGGLAPLGTIVSRLAAAVSANATANALVSASVNGDQLEITGRSTSTFTIATTVTNTLGKQISRTQLTAADSGYPVITSSGTLSFQEVDSNQLTQASAVLQSVAPSTGTSLSADLQTALADLANTFVLTGSGVSSAAANGTLNWQFNLKNSIAQYLGAGQTVTATYRISLSDDFTSPASTSQDITITITINGTNDAPVIVVTTPAANLLEAGGINNAIPGTANSSISLSKSDVDGTATYDTTYLTSNGWSSSDAGSTYTKAGTYGNASFTISTGVVSYSLNNTAAATQVLPAGQIVSENFGAIQVTDGSATTLSAALVFSITGSNDSPFVTNSVAARAGTLVEAGNNLNGSTFAGTSSATGRLSASDVDTGSTGTWSITGSPSTTYGSIAIEASTGLWTYNLDNSKLATQALAEGQSVTQTYNARVTDDLGAYADQTITITVTGTNDAPTVSVGNQSATLVEAGGSTNTVAGNPSATIGLTRVDLDGSTPTLLIDSSWVESHKLVLDFDGINDYVAIPTNSMLPSANSAYTLEAWIKPDSTGALGIVGWGNWGSSNQANALRLSGSDQLVNYWWGNDLAVNTSLSINTWYNIVARFDGTNRQLWLNNVLIGGDTPGSGHNVPNANNLTIGTTNVNEYFNGKISNVEIYNRAISDSEIAEIYNNFLYRFT